MRRALGHPSFAAGALLVALLVLAALLSLVWSPYPPAEIDIANKLARPSAAHWLGTDSLGRDVASQLLVGAQNSIVVGVVAVGIGVLVGVALGCVAAARRGWLEELLMRSADFTFAFPALLTAIMLTAIYGPGLMTSIVAIGIFNVPVFARLARAAAHTVWARDYVLAARAAGKGAWRITLDHVLPNIANVLIVQATIQFALAILAEAALSYLGLGTQPPQPSWGRMLNEAQTLMFQAPLLAVWPGMAIALSVLGLNLMGDGLRDLLDPRLARQRSRPRREDTRMDARTAQGRFTVELKPQGAPEPVDGISLGRMVLAKRFEGDLVGTGQGEMLTAMTAVKGSAGYVAIERVVGTLHGRSGSFVLQHTGTMERGAQRLSISVVPDSGTGELAGIGGTLKIDIRDGQHFYAFDYTLP